MTGNPVILVGDVGGTTTDLALLNEKLAVRAIRSFPSREYGSLSEFCTWFVNFSDSAALSAAFETAAM